MGCDSGKDETGAMQFLVEAGCYVGLASQLPAFAGDECLVCGTLLEIVSEKLADAKRLGVAREVLKRYPADRVETMQRVFRLPP